MNQYFWKSESVSNHFNHSRLLGSANWLVFTKFLCWTELFYLLVLWTPWFFSSMKNLSSLLLYQLQNLASYQQFQGCLRKESNDKSSSPFTSYQIIIQLTLNIQKVQVIFLMYRIFWTVKESNSDTEYANVDEMFKILYES